MFTRFKLWHTGKCGNRNHPIKGYVKIKFLNARGDIVKTVNAYVNSLDPFNPGQAAPFEYWDDPSEFEGITDFQVIFKDR